MYAILLVPATLAASALLVVQRPGVAFADPCPPAAVQAAPGKPARPPAAPPAQPPPAPPAQPPPAPPAPATPSASATPDSGGGGGGGGGIIGGIFDGLRRLFGGKPKAPAVEPAPAESPSPSPTPGGPAPPAGPPPPSAPPKATTSPTPCSVPARALPVDPGQPLVNATPSLMLAGTLSMKDVSFDGVVELPTKTGTIRVLRFSMTKSVSEPFELRAPAGGGRTISLRSSRLTVEDNVRFYTNRFQANIGPITLVFTPTFPPPFLIQGVPFTNARIQLVYVQCGTLTAPDLHIT